MAKCGRKPGFKCSPETKAKMAAIASARMKARWSTAEGRAELLPLVRESVKVAHEARRDPFSADQVREILAEAMDRSNKYSAIGKRWLTCGGRISRIARANGIHRVHRRRTDVPVEIRLEAAE
jgi:hypothetical protein